jgi:hypothetical protein
MICELSLASDHPSININFSVRCLTVMRCYGAVASPSSLLPLLSSPFPFLPSIWLRQFKLAGKREGTNGLACVRATRVGQVIWATRNPSRQGARHGAGARNGEQPREFGHGHSGASTAVLATATKHQQPH